MLLSRSPTVELCERKRFITLLAHNTRDTEIKCTHIYLTIIFFNYTVICSYAMHAISLNYVHHIFHYTSKTIM